MTQQDDIIQPVLTDEEINDACRRHAADTGWHAENDQKKARAVESALLSKLRAPVAETYVEARECAACGHVGINDSSDTLAACKNCDWSGDSPAEDHCPGCAQHGTMTAACPKCGGRYSLLADRTIYAGPAASAPVAGEAQPVAYWIPSAKTFSATDVKPGKAWEPLYAAPQASAENVRNVRADAFIAGFICAGGDADEAKRQAPQFQACVDAGGKSQSQPDKAKPERLP